MMRITTRVLTGLLLMTGLLIGTLAYQLSQVEKLQGINREVSLITMEAARISVRLLEGFEGVREFAAKTAVLGDQDYRTQWREWERAVDEELALLAAVGLSELEEEVFERIEEGWADYRRIADPLLDNPAVHLPEVEAVLSDLRARTEELISANQDLVAERVSTSAAAAEQARTVAWIVAVAALLLAGLLSLLLYLSIATPLKRLTRGTHEVARGRFDHRLEVAGPGELRSLAADFNQMAGQLGELETMKQDFVSHVSHELKTPLAAIHETIEIFLEEIPGPLTAKQEHLMKLSRRSSHRLASMITDLLEVSRLEAGAGSYDPDWHDLGEIVELAVDEVGPLARERGLELTLDAPAGATDLVCDPRRISEVTGNVLGNAVKFSPEGGAVRVGVSALDSLPDGMSPPDAVQAESPFLLLTVEDEGPGVPDEHKEAIFEKFHQVTGRERLRGQGVGLGMAIARRLTEAHGGAIWVEDRPGGGAIFRVLLPRVPTVWADQVPPHRLPDAAPEKEPGGAPIPVSGGAPSGALPAAVALFFLAGCASIPFLGEGASDERPPLTSGTPALNGPSGLGTSSDEPAPPTAPMRLESGWSYFELKSYGEAFREFNEALATEPSRDLQAEAHWGLALIHLFSDGPLGDELWADAALALLEEEFADTRHGLQAAWVRGLLAELERVREVVGEQEALLRELTEAVELLKQIDLNRRPARTPPGTPPP